MAKDNQPKPPPEVKSMCIQADIQQPKIEEPKLEEPKIEEP